MTEKIESELNETEQIKALNRIKEINLIRDKLYEEKRELEYKLGLN